MKKLLILTVILTTTVISCFRPTPPTLEKAATSEYPKKVIIDEGEWHITLGSDGHEYIDNHAGNAYILFHNPSCVKCLGTIGAHLQNNK